MSIGQGRAGYVCHLGFVSLLWLALVLAGCSSTDAPANGAGGASGSAGAQPAGGSAGASAGSAGQGGSSAGAPNGGGGSSGAPALWSRPTACSSLGEDCSQCGSGTVCFLSQPQVCAPPDSVVQCGLGTCTTDKPYCIDGFCMVLNDAACFCTADPGKTVAGCLIAPADHVAANMKANECHAQDTACGSTDTVPCCAGSTCAAFGNVPTTCIKECSSGADCSTGCCVPVPNSTVMICGPAANCQ